MSTELTIPETLGAQIAAFQEKTDTIAERCKAGKKKIATLAAEKNEAGLIAIRNYADTQHNDVSGERLTLTRKFDELKTALMQPEKALAEVKEAATGALNIIATERLQAQETALYRANFPKELEALVRALATSHKSGGIPAAANIDLTRLASPPRQEHLVATYREAIAGFEAQKMSLYKAAYKSAPAPEKKEEAQQEAFVSKMIVEVAKEATQAVILEAKEKGVQKKRTYILSEHEHYLALLTMYLRANGTTNVSEKFRALCQDIAGELHDKNLLPPGITYTETASVTARKK